MDIFIYKTLKNVTGGTVLEGTFPSTLYTVTSLFERYKKGIPCIFEEYPLFVTPHCCL